MRARNTTPRWRTLSVVALLLAVCVTMSPSAQMLPKSDLEQLQGHWEGKGPGGPSSVTISGNSLRFQSRPDFWYETTFTLPDATGPRQLHATIVKDSSIAQEHIGTVVVALFKVEGEALTFGVVDDFEGPPTEAIVGDWEWVSDVFEFEEARPREGDPATHDQKIANPMARKDPPVPDRTPRS